MDLQEKERLQRIFPEAEIQEYLPEPCHPGCFPAGTKVQTTLGPLPIELIQKGHRVEAFCGSNLAGAQEWREGSLGLSHEQYSVAIRTTQGELLTTVTQPLWVVDHGVILVGKIQVGMSLISFDNGQSKPAQVLSIENTGRIEPVHNLILGDGVLFLPTALSRKASRLSDATLNLQDLESGTLCATTTRVFGFQFWHTGKLNNGGRSVTSETVDRRVPAVIQKGGSQVFSFTGNSIVTLTREVASLMTAGRC